MKRKAEPAFVEEVDPETNDTLPATRRSASVNKSNAARNGYRPKRRATGDRSRTKRASSTVEATSVNCGPILQAISQYEGPQPLTILSASSDHSVGRNEVKGIHIRKFFFQGTWRHRYSKHL
jgi:hypothetical protein